MLKLYYLRAYRAEGDFLAPLVWATDAVTAAQELVNYYELDDASDIDQEEIGARVLPINTIPTSTQVLNWGDLDETMIDAKELVYQDQGCRP